ncbi:CDP-alcohol phosphatidyltransferase family protein [Jatrophihabitans sp. YIM 134969]
MATTDLPTARPDRRVPLGLYRLKPWYARRLAGVLGRLDRHHVHPDAVSAAGVAFAVGGGVALALLPTGPLTALLVLVAAALRLAAANLDGSLARRRAPRPIGWLVNEAGDRLADLALLVGLAVHVGGPLGAALLVTSCAPSFVAICAAAAGGRRHNGGPIGKTERAALCFVAALTGWFAPLAVVIAAGSVVTAGLRTRAAAVELAR